MYAIDNGNRTGRALVTVRVTDVNDNAPVFTGELICGWLPLLNLQIRVYP